LGSFDIDIGFDESILGFNGYTLGTELADPLFGQVDLSSGDLGGGVVNVAEASSLLDFSAQSDSFSLATLSFSADAVGTTGLDFLFVDLGDDFGLPLAADFTNGAVTVVPLPAALPLFLAAMAGLGVMGARRTSPHA
jgi:hypothetical protein